MASKDKLLYFDIYGRAEPVRMIYAMAGQELEDVRVSLAEWPSIKAEQPLGQMPVLTTADGTLVQSNSIARYAAKKFGLAGNSLWEETLHDMVVEATMDITKDVAMKIYPWKVLSGPKPDDSEQIMIDVKAKMVKQLPYLQSIAEKQGKKFIVGDTIGLAELWLYNNIHFISMAYPDSKELTPWIKEFVGKMEANEKFAKYLASRPASSTGF